MRTLGLALAPWVVASGCACNGQPNAGDSADPDGPGGPGGADGANTAECAAADSFYAGISKNGTAGIFAFAIVEASPAPPDVGSNAWTVAVTTIDGEPLNLDEVVVSGWMPRLEHGTADYSATEGSDGLWLFPEFELFMPGCWELSVGAIDDLGRSDTTVFSFLVEG